jgi:hypothetical protein
METIPSPSQKAKMASLTNYRNIAAAKCQVNKRGEVVLTVFAELSMFSGYLMTQYHIGRRGGCERGHESTTSRISQ